jgi:hypothetical protein
LAGLDPRQTLDGVALMEIEIRACFSEKEFGQAIAPLGHYFGRPAARQGGLIGLLPVERTYAAWEDIASSAAWAHFPSS